MMESVKKAVWPMTVVILISAVIAVFILLVNDEEKEILPPTSMTGHIEESPESQISTEPLLDKIFRHMLEHAQGDDNRGPGVIISYNCTDFECDDDLIPTLEEIVLRYDYVYLAPYTDMSRRLVITSLNRQEILEEFIEKDIVEFIEQGNEAI